LLYNSGLNVFNKPRAELGKDPTIPISLLAYPGYTLMIFTFYVFYHMKNSNVAEESYKMQRKENVV
jgi:hypothetical protein